MKRRYLVTDSHDSSKRVKIVDSKCLQSVKTSSNSIVLVDGTNADTNAVCEDDDMDELISVRNCSAQCSLDSIPSHLVLRTLTTGYPKVDVFNMAIAFPSRAFSKSESNLVHTPARLNPYLCKYSKSSNFFDSIRKFKTKSSSFNIVEEKIPHTDETTCSSKKSFGCFII